MRPLEPAIQPATLRAELSQEGSGPAVIAAPGMTVGRLHDLIDEATRFMGVAELQAVLDFAKAVLARRPKVA